MTAKEIRQRYLKFMADKGHQIIPRASLVPQEDATTLFTGSGMQPMVPYLLGEAYPGGLKRIADSQVVFRAVDIDDVGDSEHLTSFEMLGNWSLGDYFKAEQIPWLCEFLFDVIELDISRIYVTCYIGNPELGIPRDDEAITLWKQEFLKRGIEAKVVELGTEAEGNKRGIEDGRIFLYEGKENWWARGIPELNTPIGDPCGPCSEVFFDFGEQYENEERWGKAHPAGSSPRFTEIGNSVFMGYKRTDEAHFDKLTAPNIDFGAGLERLAMAKLGVPDISQIDLTAPLIKKTEELSGISRDEHARAFRVIADHIKSACWLATDGVTPSNTQQGYVLRRLVRRAVKYAIEIGITNNLVQQLAPVFREIYGDDYPEVNERFSITIDILDKEEKAFRQTLTKGLHELEKITSRTSTKPFSGQDIFLLHDTYGFPKELTLEELAVRNLAVDENWEIDYNLALAAQKELSRTASAGQFKGGLEDPNDPTIIKYHTATHLMYRALRNVLGDHVVQRGSNITRDRLRFDFSHPEKMTPEQIQQVEAIVNQQIEKDWPMSWREENTQEALSSGVMGAFGDRYGEMVKVYTVGDPESDYYSREICGGPHVEHTGVLADGGKHFAITKEESSSAGVRRIKAILK
ncbi:alanine--tRNA ligase [Candidatus Saccharibacteria bacterium]|nr:alanine--tRNA ligase [Candidatus Saccharibacteria bacterium]